MFYEEQHNPNIFTSELKLGFFKEFLLMKLELNSCIKIGVSCIRVLAGYEFVYVFSCIYKIFVFFVYVSCITLIIKSCIFVYLLF